MIELRKTTQRNSSRHYKNRPLIRVAKSTQAKFIVSKLIAERLKINTDTEAVMFGIKDKKLHIFKEEKDTDNYHLGVGDQHTLRFRSVELYDFLSDFYGVSKDKEFYLEMQKDNSFVLTTAP